MAEASILPDAAVATMPAPVPPEEGTEAREQAHNHCKNTLPCQVSASLSWAHGDHLAGVLGEAGSASATRGGSLLHTRPQTLPPLLTTGSVGKETGWCP